MARMVAKADTEATTTTVKEDMLHIVPVVAKLVPKTVVASARVATRMVAKADTAATTTTVKEDMLHIVPVVAKLMPKTAVATARVATRMVGSKFAISGRKATALLVKIAALPTTDANA